ncbi:hypothetical protein C8J57DRAFT_1543611 [Mycena rebaudengoi]|nr:hypothetical protein C8J57DRAFT_1543611 [Mycena rebaudengoi]
MDGDANISLPASLLAALLNEMPQWDTAQLPALKNLSKMITRSHSEHRSVPSTVTASSVPASTAPTLPTVTALIAPTLTSSDPTTPERRTSGRLSAQSSATTPAATPPSAPPAPQKPKNCDKRNSSNSSHLRVSDKKQRARQAAAASRPSPSPDGAEEEVDNEQDEDFQVVTGAKKRKPADRGPFIANKRPCPTLARGGEFLTRISWADEEEGREQISQLINLLCSGSYQAPPITAQTSISGLLQLCDTLANDLQGREYYFILVLIRLRLALNRPGTLQDVDIARNVNMNPNTLGKYKAQGAKLIAWIAGGSFYMIFIIAALGLRGTLCGPSIEWTDINSTVNALRDPDPLDSWGSTVILSIIPVIQRLRHHPLLANWTAPGSTSCTPHLLSSPAQPFTDLEILFRDIAINDLMCDQVKHNGIKFRNRNFYWDLLNQSPPEIVRNSHALDAIHITSKVVLPSSYTSPVDNTNRVEWTAAAREHAEQAPKAKSLDDFIKAMKKMKANDQSALGNYIRLDSKLCEGKTLDIKAKNSEPLVLLVTHLRQVLGDKIDAIPSLLCTALGDGLVDTDSSQANYNYEAIHVTIYNRFAEDGSEAPLDNEHPDYLSREHVTRVNWGQRIPHSSEETVKNASACESLAGILTDICLFVKENMFHHRRGVSKKLDFYISFLPGNRQCPYAPFGGVVINMGGCSEAHADELDLENHCVVMPFTKNCVGGALALHEVGLILDLHSGDMVVFLSARITHYNLHFKGKRASLVFQSDSSLKKWANANGWNGANGVQLEDRAKNFPSDI